MVDVMDSEDRPHLCLLGRPELGVTFTKIHCWTLTQYNKCVFVDADTLVSGPSSDPPGLRGREPNTLSNTKLRACDISKCTTFSDTHRVHASIPGVRLVTFDPLPARCCVTWTSCSRGTSCRRPPTPAGPTASTRACLCSGRRCTHTPACCSTPVATAASMVTRVGLAGWGHAGERF